MPPRLVSLRVCLRTRCGPACGPLLSPVRTCTEQCLELRPGSRRHAVIGGIVSTRLGFEVTAEIRTFLVVDFLGDRLPTALCHTWIVVLAHLAHVQVCPAAATLGGTRERQRMLSNGCPALQTHKPFHHAVILIRFEQTAVQAVPFCGSAKH